MIGNHPSGELYGYAGKILRIDLTSRTTETIPTGKYASKYIGGAAMCNAIFWDEVRGKVGALEPENKLVLMTGPLTGSGVPASGHSTMTGISASSLPEQYTHSSIGGLFGATLKYAGYDGFILEGKADSPTYVYIENDTVKFLDAAPLWGMLVAESQNEIKRLHGDQTHAMVIGPAGENLCRTATIVTSNDSVSGKAGFGAVLGSKNCKAIAVKGTGSIKPASVEKILSMRKDPSNAPAHPNPMQAARVSSPIRGSKEVTIDGDVKRIYQTPCAGCNDHCAVTDFNIDDPLGSTDKIGIVEKCIGASVNKFINDTGFSNGRTMHARSQEVPGAWRWCAPSVKDPDSPEGKFLLWRYPGDRYDLWDGSPEFAFAIRWCCNQYGLDKWDTMKWPWSWLAMCKKEGLLDDLDVGVEVDDITSPDFVNKFFYNLTYRIGAGDLFAEGMARAIRKLGKEKYGDSIYHGRYNSVTGERLDIPVSIEACWGQSSHWLGRGYQGCEKTTWLHEAISWMLDTRDGSTNNHPCVWMDEYMQYKDDPCHSPLFVEEIIRSCDEANLKDTLTLCDFRFPNPTWPEQAPQSLEAVTGIVASREELYDLGVTSRLLYRAILMRDYGRCRDFEVEAIFPWLTWPDPFGERASWNDFNDLVDGFYKENGWDLATGWPYRSTWERYGLKHIADEMEQLGKLPPEGGTPGYVRKACPFTEVNCPVRE